MTTLKVEIDKERGLPAVQALLKRIDLNFKLEEDDYDWGDLPETAIEGTKAGLADGEAGSTHSHEYVMNHINEKTKFFAGEIFVVNH